MRICNSDCTGKRHDELPQIRDYRNFTRGADKIHSTVFVLFDESKRYEIEASCVSRTAPKSQLQQRTLCDGKYIQDPPRKNSASGTDCSSAPADHLTCFRKCNANVIVSIIFHHNLILTTRTRIHRTKKQSPKSGPTNVSILRSRCMYILDINGASVSILMIKAIKLKKKKEKRKSLLHQPTFRGRG